MKVCKNCLKICDNLYGGRCSYACKPPHAVPQDCRVADLSHDDKAALIASYSGLLLKISWRLCKRYRDTCDHEDAFQECAIGMMRAINNYNPDESASFFTYAYRCVWTHADSQINHDRLVRVPSNLVRPALANQHDPADEDWSRRVAAARRAIYGLLSADDTTDTDGVSLKDIIPDRPTEETYEPQPLLAEAMSKLKPRDRDVLISRYADEKTLKEIGRPLGVTKERVRQIGDKACQKVREFLDIGSDGVLTRHRPAPIPESVKAKLKHEAKHSFDDFR